MRLWIDTDVGTNPDDAVALLCAAAHPDIELVGVSTVAGDTCERAAVARGLVDVPVVPGEELDAYALDASRPDAVLAIGPLTNLARLFESGYRPRRLAVMGGARVPVRHRGEVRDVEHNFGADPVAAHAVFEQVERILVSPLDVTARMRLSEEDRVRLVEVAPALGPMCADWIARQRAACVPAEEAVICLHDPVALLALTGDPGIRIEPIPLTVGPDGRVGDDAGAPVRDVVVDVDARAVLERTFALLEGASR